MVHYKQKGVSPYQVGNEMTVEGHDFGKKRESLKSQKVAPKGTTISLSLAHKAHNMGNAYIAPNPPDVMKTVKGCAVVGIV
jgi:hypothetical protein